MDFLALRSLLIVHTSVTVTAGSTFRAYRRLDVSLYTIRLSVRTKGCHLVTAKLKDANGEQTFTEVKLRKILIGKCTTVCGNHSGIFVFGENLIKLK